MAGCKTELGVNMLKKLNSFLLTILLVASFTVTTFASGDFVTVGRPYGDETVFKTSYMISGNANEEGVAVSLYIYDASLEDYVPLKTVDGETEFVVGASGFFMREVVLNQGENQIMINSFYEYDRENIQSDKFTITVLKESMRDRIKGGFMKLNEMLRNAFDL